MNYKRFIYYQGTVSMASSMIFPFYILLIRNVGDSYAQFGWAYGLFALTAALCYPLIGKYADRVGDKTFLAVYSWGMATLLLFFPLASEVWHGYILQVLMGVLGAVQRNSEKNGSGAMSQKKLPARKLAATMSGPLSPLPSPSSPPAISLIF